LLATWHGYSDDPGSRHNTLARALFEYGWLIRTLVILRDLTDPDLQRRVHGQLNKGERVHALHRRLLDGQRRPHPSPPPRRPTRKPAWDEDPCTILNVLERARAATRGRYVRAPAQVGSGRHR
jgi:hypothetical protein